MDRPEMLAARPRLSGDTAELTPLVAAQAGAYLPVHLAKGRLRRLGAFSSRPGYS